MERIVVIHGPARTGKTFHAEAFRQHYGATFILDEGEEHLLKDKIAPGALILLNHSPDHLARRLFGALIVSIEDARKAIGVGPVSSIPPPFPRTLRFVTPQTSVRRSVQSAFADLNVKLPFRPCDEDVGSVLDGDGIEIFVVDHNAEMPAEKVTAIAGLMVEILNGCADARVTVHG